LFETQEKTDQVYSYVEDLDQKVLAMPDYPQGC